MVDATLALHDEKKELYTAPSVEAREVKVILSGIDKRTINRVALEFYDLAKEIDPALQLPVIAPTEEACFTTRKSPCGNGTATFSRKKLRVYTRVFTLNTDFEGISRLSDFLVSAPVDADWVMNS